MIELSTRNRTRNLRSHRAAILEDRGGLLGFLLGLKVHVEKDVPARQIAEARPHIQNDRSRNQAGEHDKKCPEENPSWQFRRGRILHDLVERVRVDRREQFLDRFAVVVLVRRVDIQKEPVVRRTIELGVRKDRVAELGESVQGQHSQNRSKCGEQNRQLERHWDRRGGDPKGFARDDVLVVHPIHPPLHKQCCAQAGQTCTQNDERENRRFDSQGVVDPVDRERSECIGLGVTSIPNLLGRMEQIVFVLEFRHPTASLRRPRLFIRFDVVFVVIHINR